MENNRHQIRVCQQCGTKNRVQPDRFNESARCGKCGSPLKTAATGERLKGFFFFRCSTCRTRNKIPAIKIDDHPKCGKCGTPIQTEELFVSQPLMITDSNFDSKVLKSPLPVLLFAWAPWCPTCKAVDPVIDEFARDAKGKVRVGKLNVDGNPMLSSKYHIRAVPFLFIFDNGRLLETLPGAVNKQDLMMKMARYL